MFGLPSRMRSCLCIYLNLPSRLLLRDLGKWGGRAERVWTTRWVGFRKPVKHCWLECCRGNWKRKQDGFWASSGYFPGILDFFRGTGRECVPREQIWWKQKISWFSKFASQDELRREPRMHGAKQHGERGKWQQVASGRCCECGRWRWRVGPKVRRPGFQSGLWNHPPLFLGLVGFPPKHLLAPCST